MSKVVIFGASGFVGATLLERLLAKGTHEIVPVIHSPGNAWRPARHHIELFRADLSTGDNLDPVLHGADVVINCSRGSDHTMVEGLKNLLIACKRHRIKRLVHISSVMIYGDPPRAEDETTPPVKQPLTTYGGIKLKQDNMVIAATEGHFQSVILVPPNISGPRSDYLQGVLQTINNGQFALMDDGAAPINLLDIDNLCLAIELAMTEGPGDGSRYFITDDENTCWSDVIHDLQKLQTTDGKIIPIQRATLEQITRPTPKPKHSMGSSIKHLFSSHIREALRKDPLWEKMDHALRGLVAKMGNRMENTLRLSIEGPAMVNRRSNMPTFNHRLCGQQLREGRHSIAKARRELGYRPETTYCQSMANFQSWYRRVHGLDSEFADLLRQLY